MSDSDDETIVEGISDKEILKALDALSIQLEKERVQKTRQPTTQLGCSNVPCGKITPRKSLPPGVAAPVTPPEALAGRGIVLKVKLSNLCRPSGGD